MFCEARISLTTSSLLIVQQLAGYARNVSFLLLECAHRLIIPTASQLTNPLLLAGDGKCVICDSYVRPATLVRVCDECNYGSYAGRCVICGGIGVSDAYYCKECTIQEKDVS